MSPTTIHWFTSCRWYNDAENFNLGIVGSVKADLNGDLGSFCLDLDVSIVTGGGSWDGCWDITGPPSKQHPTGNAWIDDLTQNTALGDGTWKRTTVPADGMATVIKGGGGRAHLQTVQHRLIAASWR